MNINMLPPLLSKNTSQNHVTRKNGKCIEKFRTTEVQNFRAGSDLVCYESNSYVARNLTVNLPRQRPYFIHV